MDIEQVKEEKRNLESKINFLLLNFTKETGMNVVGIDLDYIFYLGSNKTEVFAVKVKTELP